MYLSRRELFESLGIAAAGAITAGYTATAKGYAANETINVGCIGTGGRCRKLMESLATIPGVRIAAVCDIWDMHLDEGKKLAEPKAFATKDYQRAARPQGHRRRADRHARPLARADDDRRLRRRQGRLRREAADARPVRRGGGHRGPERPPADRAGRHAAAEHAAHSERRTSSSSRASSARSTRCISPGTATQPRSARPNLNIDPKTVDWKQFLGNAPDQPFDEYRFPQLALVLGFRRRHLHRPDGPLDRRGPLVPRPRSSRHGGQHRRPVSSAKDVWETPDTVQTLLRYPDSRTCRSTSKGRSSTPATPR